MKSQKEYFQSRRECMLDLQFRSDGMELLWSYIELLWKSNSELNLFSRQMSFEELIDNHVIDCLLALPFFPENIQCAADFGSGGGLPGVIYALQFPQIEYHLYEKSPKKQEFLTRCQKLAPNLRVKGEIPLQLDKVQLVTARAFKPLDVILDMSRNYAQAGGHYFLLKGRREKIDEEYLLAKKKFKHLEVKIQPLISPLMQVERHLVLI
jgi:16S rRNA (guanine527-N7)-methyltransferase